MVVEVLEIIGLHTTIFTVLCETVTVHIFGKFVAVVHTVQQKSSGRNILSPKP
jgi:hypothetical protein